MGYPVFCIRKECMDTKTRIDLNQFIDNYNEMEYWIFLQNLGSPLREGS